MPTALHWFRQDLRLLDNPALTAALAGADRVVTAYVLADGPGGAALGGAAKWWLHHSLASLGAAIAAIGGHLVLRQGEAVEQLRRLAREAGAETVHVNTCPEPHWRDADAALAKALEKDGRRLVCHTGTRMYGADTPRTKQGGIYGMYTPYARALAAQPPPAPPLKEPAAISPGPTLASDKLADWGLLPTKPDWAGGLRATWKPGEAEARARGREFLKDAVRQYETGRNLPGQDLTSRLSPYLHWGEISANTLWHALHRHGLTGGESVWAAELIWREFGAYLLWHNPALPEKPLRPAFEALPWRNDKKSLAAWQRGRTGVPIVDAGMRQLWHTGWMHNRVRMIVASFLVKHLLIDWRHGAAWFMDTLVDADLASNSMNWQWVAGTGIDSQPFFRVFNPVGQSEKFDGGGAYLRAHLPELARLPDKFIHAPWAAPEAIRQHAGVSPKTYPAPLIDLAAGRQRALETYRHSVRGEPAPE